MIDGLGVQVVSESCGAGEAAQIEQRATAKDARQGEGGRMTP